MRVPALSIAVGNMWCSLCLLGAYVKERHSVHADGGTHTSTGLLDVILEDKKLSRGRHFRDVGDSNVIAKVSFKYLNFYCIKWVRLKSRILIADLLQYL